MITEVVDNISQLYIRDDESCIELGALREFFNEELSHLPDNTPVKLSVCEPGDEAVVPCVCVQADKESVELYYF